jgi:hypothetical protein
VAAYPPGRDWVTPEAASLMGKARSWSAYRFLGLVRA